MLSKKFLSTTLWTASVLALSAVLLNSTSINPGIAMDSDEEADVNMQETTSKKRQRTDSGKSRKKRKTMDQDGSAPANTGQNKSRKATQELAEVKEEPDVSRGVHTEEYIREKMPLANPQNGKINCLKCAVSGYRFLKYQTSAPDKVNTKGPKDWNYDMNRNGRDLDLIDFDQAALLPSGKIQLVKAGKRWIEDVSIDHSAPITFKEKPINEFLDLLKIMPFKPWYNDHFQTGLLFLAPSNPKDEGGHWINFYSYKKGSNDQVDLLIDFQHKEIFSPTTLSEYVKKWNFNSMIYVWYESSRQPLGERIPVKAEVLSPAPLDNNEILTSNRTPNQLSPTVGLGFPLPASPAIPTHLNPSVLPPYLQNMGNKPSSPVLEKNNSSNSVRSSIITTTTTTTARPSSVVASSIQSTPQFLPLADWKKSLSKEASSSMTIPSGSLSTAPRPLQLPSGQAPLPIPRIPQPNLSAPLRAPSSLARANPSFYGSGQHQFGPVLNVQNPGIQPQPHFSFPGQMQAPYAPPYGLSGVRQNLLPPNILIQHHISPLFNPSLDVASHAPYPAPLPVSSIPYRATHEENVSLPIQEQNSSLTMDFINQEPSQISNPAVFKQERRESPERSLNTPIEVGQTENSVTEDEEMSDNVVIISSSKPLAPRPIATIKKETLDNSTSTTTTTTTTITSTTTTSADQLSPPHPSIADPSPNPRPKTSVSTESAAKLPEEDEESSFHGDSESDDPTEKRQRAKSSKKTSTVKKKSAPKKSKKRKREEDQEDLEPPAKKQKKTALKASKKRQKKDLENDEENSNEGSSPHDNSDDQENNETLSELSTIKKPVRPAHKALTAADIERLKELAKTCDYPEEVAFQMKCGIKTVERHTRMKAKVPYELLTEEKKGEMERLAREEKKDPIELAVIFKCAYHSVRWHLKPKGLINNPKNMTEEQEKALLRMKKDNEKMKKAHNKLNNEEMGKRVGLSQQQVTAFFKSQGLGKFDRLSKEQKKEIVERAQKGEKREVLRLEYKCSLSSINRILKEAGVEYPDKKLYRLTEADQEKIKTEYKKKTQDKLADEIGCDRSTVGLWIKKFRKEEKESKANSSITTAATMTATGEEPVNENMEEPEEDEESSFHGEFDSNDGESERRQKATYRLSKKNKQRKIVYEEAFLTLTPEEKAEMKRLRETTDSNGEEIANIMGLSSDIVCAYLNSIGLFITQKNISLTEEQKAKIEELNKDPNKSRADIVRETGCSPYLVNKHIEMIGAPKNLKRKPLTNDEKAEIKRLAETTTLSRRKIAAKLGRKDHKLVSKYLDSIGIYAKPRPDRGTKS